MYSDFDQASFPTARIGSDYRTPFAIDRDRVVHSRAFRRLQAKTQVFSTGEYDFYRTRLTHSVEVGQIGRSICAFLASTSASAPKVDTDLVEAACLSHDLGNPPFGHSGERTLHTCMQKYGGFEGNAQTMRLLTKRIFTSENGRSGIYPTRALMDAVCKYKRTWTQDAKKHFLYLDQRECLSFIHDNVECTEQSLECQIMDWSDDIANAYADINDGVKARLITVTELENWRGHQVLDEIEQQMVESLIGNIRKGTVEKFRAMGIGDAIKGTVLVRRDNALSDRTPRYLHGIEREPVVAKHCALMKKIAYDIVIESALVQQLEAKTSRMMSDLFDLFIRNYSAEKPKVLLPHDAHREVLLGDGEEERARFICDHLSGMSDDFAIRTYRRLFDPLFGSIGDFI